MKKIEAIVMIMIWVAPGLLAQVRTIGEKVYELSNHLGNVTTTVTDRKLNQPVSGGATVVIKEPDIITSNDYYPYGILMEGRTDMISYRFGFQGQEQENEAIGEGRYSFDARLYDGRIGHWWSTDPIAGKYPFVSPYQYVNNSPMFLIDPTGNEWVNPYAKEADKVRAQLNNPDANFTKREVKKLNKKLSSLDKLSKRVETLITNLKTNDPELYEYIENLQVSYEDSEGEEQTINVGITVFVIDKTDHDSRGYKWGGVTTRNSFKDSQLKGKYNGKEIFLPLSASPQAGTQYQSLYKTGIGFTVVIEDAMSFSDNSLANEAGDVMYVMEKNEEAKERDDKGIKSDPQNNYGEYSTTGPGKYSFDVEDVYKNRKAGKEPKNSNMYPIKQ